MKSRPRSRIFLELANNEVTPEWVAKKYKARGVEQPPFEQISPSIIAMQKEIRGALDSLDEGWPVFETTFPLLYAFEKKRVPSKKKHLRSDLDGNPITHVISDNKIDDAFRSKGVTSKKYSFIAADAAQDFLRFLENDIEKSSRCQYTSCGQFFLYTRSDQQFCNDKCRSKFYTDKIVTSGKAAERQKYYRERLKEQPDEIHLGNIVLIKAAEGKGNKDIDCPHYRQCLGAAATTYWPNFSCEACPLKQ
jgi:hypothetical protein